MSDDKVVMVKDGSGGAWLIGIVLLIAVIVGGYFAMQYLDSNSAKNNAVSQAAHDVGKAANQVGNAAQDAGGNK